TMIAMPPIATAVSTGDREPASEVTVSSRARAAPRGARSGAVIGPPGIGLRLLGPAASGAGASATVAVYEPLRVFRRSAPASRPLESPGRTPPHDHHGSADASCPAGGAATAGRLLPSRRRQPP